MKKLNDYKFLRQLGVGAYSKVYKSIDTKTGDFVAVKEIPHSKMSKHLIDSREIKSLLALSGHPNIVKLLDSFSTMDATYLVFEYLPTDLISFYSANELSAGNIRYIMFQILSAIAYMHSKKLMHRDLKP